MTHRYIARIVLEAQTPLFAGSGASSLTSDAVVHKDVFGFPMIQGTSLTGVLRHAMDEKTEEWNSFFGYQEEVSQKAEDRKRGKGSQLRISSAYLVLDDGDVAEYPPLTDRQNEILQVFDRLPSRQHVRINAKGVAENGELFDNEVVFKGCRFKFELELRGDESDRTRWETLLKVINNPSFRVGQGTRNGYGNLTVHSCHCKTYDLDNVNDFTAYLNFDPSLNKDNDLVKTDEYKVQPRDEYGLNYTLTLQPDDTFFLFGSGYGDSDVDNIPVTEPIIEYLGDETKFYKSDPKTLIPASSIKGAIRHRTCFHYFKLKKQFIDEKPNLTIQQNEAVYALFGAEKGFERQPFMDKEQKEYGRRGSVLLDDQYIDADNEKIFNHVAIDRFTGGAMDGALFSEKVSRAEKEIKLNISIEGSGYDNEIIQAFENALIDICNGRLPLGGMTTKGHGIFNGTITGAKTNLNYHKND